MKRVILPIGPQSAGKSTFCKKVISEFPEILYVSRDEILSELFEDTWISHYDDEFYAGLEEMWQRVSAIFRQSDFTLILDTWNFPTHERVWIVNRLNELGVTEIEAWHFITPLTVCREWSFIRNPPVVELGNQVSELMYALRTEGYDIIHAAFLELAVEEENLFDRVKQIDASTAKPGDVIDASG